MPKRDLGAFSFLDNKNFRITIPLTTLICFVLLLLIEHLGGNGGQDFAFQGLVVHRVRVYLQLLPVMLNEEQQLHLELLSYLQQLQMM